MRGISLFVSIIMIHSCMTLLAASSGQVSMDFNKEIEMVAKDQFDSHKEILNQTRATEAAYDFENKYRKPAPSKALTFFPLRLRTKPAMKKTKVAESAPPVPGSTLNSRANMIQLYREQVL